MTSADFSKSRMPDQRMSTATSDDSEVSKTSARILAVSKEKQVFVFGLRNEPCHVGSGAATPRARAIEG